MLDVCLPQPRLAALRLQLCIRRSRYIRGADSLRVRPLLARNGAGRFHVVPCFQRLRVRLRAAAMCAQGLAQAAPPDSHHARPGRRVGQQASCAVAAVHRDWALPGVAAEAALEATERGVPGHGVELMAPLLALGRRISHDGRPGLAQDLERRPQNWGRLGGGGDHNGRHLAQAPRGTGDTPALLLAGFRGSRPGALAGLDRRWHEFYLVARVLLHRVAPRPGVGARNAHRLVQGLPHEVRADAGDR
mmetsp:Transcript_79134/g.228858  ORF Transcript_79134/g.228858 Transcript_79134/m.228858 type:complete len:247 (+) Transcript_79134:453-1193(+)